MSWWRRLTIATAAALLAGGAAPGPGLAQQPIQLRFMSWYFGEDPAGPTLKALFAEFEKRNPTITGGCFPRSSWGATAFDDHPVRPAPVVRVRLDLAHHLRAVHGAHALEIARDLRDVAQEVGGGAGARHRRPHVAGVPDGGRVEEDVRLVHEPAEDPGRVLLEVHPGEHQFAGGEGDATVAFTS